MVSERPGDDGIWATLRDSSIPVRAMLVGVLVNRLGAFLQVFLVLFLTNRGFTDVEAGFALACYGAGSFAGIVLGGALADRLGPRYATLLSMIGTALLLIVVLYVRALPAVYVSVLLCGLVAQLYRPAAAALLSELTPQHQQVMIYAIYRLMINVGTTAAPLLAALLITFSYDLLFWVEAGAALVYAVIAAITLPRRKSPDKAGKAALDGGPKGYRAVLADRRFVLYLVALFINSLVYIQYVSTLPLTIQDAGIATFWYSILISLNGFIVITCELLVTKVTQHLPIKLVVIAGFTLFGIGQALYALPLGVAIFVIGTLLWTIAEIVGGPTMMSYAGVVAPENLRGRYISSMQTMFSLGAAVGPALGTAGYHLLGRNVWLLFGLTCLVGMVFALLGMRRPNDLEPARTEPDPAEETPPATTTPAAPAAVADRQEGPQST
jgi:MFS family permease